MKTLSLACIALLAASSGVANATSANVEAPRRVVAYDDLDVNSEAGAAALMQRINAAARALCGAPGVEWMPLATLTRTRRCTEAAVAEAVEHVGAASLTRVAVGDERSAQAL